MKSIDYLSGANAAYVDEMYARWQSDPASVEPLWQAFFAGFEAGWKRPAPASDRGEASGDAGVRGIFGLVNAYREFGHLVARLDPLGRQARTIPFLDLGRFGCSESDLGRALGAGGFRGPEPRDLGHLLEMLQATYCRTISVECMDIREDDHRQWIAERVEPGLNTPRLTSEEKRRLLWKLLEAEGFEQFLQTKYLGQKRFSIEGGESLLPLLDTLIGKGGEGGVLEMIFGMAHRGRLNVLAHVLRKPYEEILGEFEGLERSGDSVGDGDVKYHQGYSHDLVSSDGKKIHLSLSPNPSHLELVDPVIEGLVWAKQEYLRDRERLRVIPVQIHGDAAFAGQGIVPETLLLSELQHYSTGGTIHVVVNNQIGFTAMPHETRFTAHPTDIVKIIQAPIFHVNADDPEAVVHVARMAFDYRQRFKVDVAINLVCYRRYGHNETDDPSFTQPLMYRKIDGHPSVTRIYGDKLVQEGVVTPAEIEAEKARVRDRLQGSLENAQRTRSLPKMSAFGGVWSGMSRAGSDWGADTALPAEEVQRLGEALLAVPEGFKVHRKIERGVLGERRRMFAGERGVDWATAESLAFGSLLSEGFPVRLAGQDSERGTFSHRHCVLHDFETDARWVPLQNVREGQAPFVVVNTMLSELAVLGFELGVSWADPRRLVVWEAQFGDFANGAQAIIDQFLATSETKWDRMSGLVLLLPHGYEGQGPEHSSARLERFLQLCAEDNIQVCSPTTPAQYFHVLRRQLHRRFRKPLVIMAPKSLLRHPEVVSNLEAFSEATFQPLLDDARVGDPSKVRRVAFSTGKVWYTLDRARVDRGVEDVALVRLEQIHPFPEDAVIEALRRYGEAREVLWVQEEPRNMGAWTFVEPRLRELLGGARQVEYCGRDAASSPAVGSYKVHQAEEAELLDRFFGSKTAHQDLDVVGGRRGATA